MRCAGTARPGQGQLPRRILLSQPLNDWRTLLAIRLFRAASANQLISFVGSLSVGGLALAVAVLVTVLSVVNGFERELEDRVLAIVPHGILYDQRYDQQGSGGRLEQLADELRQQPLVRGLAPMVEGSGILVSKGKLHGVIFKGVDADRERDVSILPDFMTAGSFDAIRQPFAMLIGAYVAETLGLAVGDRVTLALPEVHFGLAGPALTIRGMRVGGIFETGADLDKSQVLVSLDDAKRLKRQTHIDGLVVSTDDIFAAPNIMLHLGRDHGLGAQSWNHRHGTLYDAIQTQKATMFMLLMILVCVAAFNVVSNLVMTVDDNRGKVAMLRTLGASPGHIRVIFILHGLLVGVLGVLLGLALGLLLAFGLAEFFGPITQALGVSPMDEYFVRYLPVEVRLADLVQIAGVALAICLLATIYPASRAAAAKPAAALAHEV
ncbi:MAG: ABC transporter permease [Pseudomonadales bacterium]